jgi:hypothetical protein
MYEDYYALKGVREGESTDNLGRELKLIRECKALVGIETYNTEQGVQLYSLE